MKILVLGGAGFLGSVLVPILLEHGNDVTVLDNFLYSGDSLLNCCNNSHFNLIRGDAKEKDIIKKALQDQDIIIPLAALVGQSLCESNQNESYAVNVGSIAMLLENRNSEQIIIFPSTQSCYGANDCNNLCDEKSIISPLSQYAKTKTEAERIILEQPNTVAFRIGTLFGVSARMRIDLSINNFVYRALYDKFIVLNTFKTFRNYLHVRDAANLFLFAINNFEKVKGNVFNVGHIDLNLSQEDICIIIKKHITNFYYYSHNDNAPYDRRNYKVSLEKIYNLGWKANISIDEGIVELVKAFTLIKPYKYSNII